MKKGLLITLVLFSWAVCMLPLSAVATTFSDRSSWEAAVDNFTDVDLTGFSQYEVLAAGSAINLSASDGSISFDQRLEALQVGSGWATWSGGKSPMVLWTQGATIITGTFSDGIFAFGLEMQPNPFGFHDMTLLLSDGSSLTQSVTGSSGAAFFGFVSDLAISAITMSSTADFAFGEMVVGAPVPEPSTLLLLGGGLLGLGYLNRKRKKV